MNARLAFGVALLALGLSSGARADSLEARRSDARAIVRGAGRLDAITRTCALDAGSLPAIRERIADIRAHGRPTSDAGYVALTDFIEASGGTGAADPRELLPGLRAFPGDGFSAVHANVAERYCLLRSLEHIGTAEALVAALPLVAYDIRAFRWQARHLVRRAGRRSVAMLVRARGYSNPEITLWSGWGLVELGIRDSGNSVQDQDEESLIAVLAAYPAANHLGGMPVVASFVDDPRLTIRTAARAGLAAYGDNAVWELRRLHQTRLGRDPGAQSASTLLQGLARELDRRREAPLHARAAAALAATDDATARTLADSLLADSPISSATRKLAPLLLRQARADADAGRVDAARSRLETARRLGANGDEVRALATALDRARLESRGVYETSELPSLPTATNQALVTRREVAFFGFLAAFVLLAGPAIGIIGARVGRRGTVVAARGARLARRRWNEGGRDATVSALAIVRERVGELATRTVRSAIAIRGGFSGVAPSKVADRPASRGSIPSEKVDRGSETADDLLGDVDAFLAERRPRTDERAGVATTEAPPRPTADSPAASSSTTARRRDRPTRKATASVDLFTSAPAKRNKSA